MSGRTSVLDPAGPTPWAGSDTSFPVWKIAVATLLPTLSVLLIAWQVRVPNA